MRAAGTRDFHFPHERHGAAAETLEVDVVMIRSTRRAPAAQPLLERALPDVAEHARAGAALGAARLQRFEPLDPAHLAATQAFESYFATPIHARSHLFDALPTLRRYTIACVPVSFNPEGR
jgi:hypothetical protein